MTGRVIQKKKKMIYGKDRNRNPTKSDPRPGGNGEREKSELGSGQAVE